MLNNTRFGNNEHAALSSEENSFGVDDTSFPNTMRIMAENKTEFFDSSEALHR